MAALESWLTAHVAGHALANKPWTFYEVVDRYLGPFGDSGYPIGYGKKYAMLFTSNRTLAANPVTKEWVQRTCTLLQEELAAFIVARYQAGTLARLTEPELRRAAFDSHPRAYTEGGLATVAAVAPELIPEIASIPATEFSPTSENFSASLRQAWETAGLVVPQVAGLYLASAALPAHTGGLAHAADLDRRRFLAMIQLGDFLGSLKRKIVGGEMDNIVALEHLTSQLYGQKFPDQGYADAAREIITIANQRKIQLAWQFEQAIRRDPGLAATYDRVQPGWRRWLR